MTAGKIFNGFGTITLVSAGFSFFIMFYSLLCAIGYMINSILKNYKNIQGNIKTNAIEKNQILTYFVDKEYTQILPFSTTKQNNNSASISSPAYNNGPCTVYYLENNPDDYYINYNPSLIFGGITSIICILTLFSGIYFYFLYTNPNAAGVIGGLQAINGITNPN